MLTLYQRRPEARYKNNNLVIDGFMLVGLMLFSVFRGHHFWMQFLTQVASSQSIFDLSKEKG